MANETLISERLTDAELTICEWLNARIPKALVEPYIWENRDGSETLTFVIMDNAGIEHDCLAITGRTSEDIADKLDAIMSAYDEFTVLNAHLG